MAKIVFAVSHSEQAGAQLIWADMAGALRSRGHDVRLIAIYPGTPEIAALPRGLEWTHCVPCQPRTLPGLWTVLRSAARHVRSWSPDVVFSALPAANTIFPLAYRLAPSRPSVFTSHHSPAFTYGRVHDRMDGLVGATSAVARIICVSAAVQTSLEHKSPRYRAKTIVIRNALPPAMEALTAQLRSRREATYRPGRKVIACGRLAEQKNYKVLIRALAHASDATLEIIGAGPDEAALRAMADEYGVADRLAFLGLMPREAALSLIATRDVFVQPSLFEGHSLALIEAARIGIPMIVSNVPSQIEAVTDASGQLCAMTHDPHDPAALGEALRQMLGNDTARHRYQALAAGLGDQISFARMADGYEALIREHRPHSMPDWQRPKLRLA